MNDLYNKINNLNLRGLLLSNPIDGEELLFESKGNVTCSQNGIDKQVEGILFATNIRMGYITVNGDSYYFNNNMNLRDIFINDSKKIIQLVFADGENDSNTDKDYYINFYADEDYDLFFSSVFDILFMRFSTPMKCITPLIDEAINNVYDNKFNEAIEVLNLAKKLDGRTAVIDLLKARILKMMGKSKQAAIMLAKGFDYYCAISYGFVMRELLEYEWTPAAVRYLPPLDECNEFQIFLINALIAKSEHKNKEYVSNIYAATRWLKLKNYQFGEFWVLIGLIGDYCSKDTEDILKPVGQELTKIIKEDILSNLEGEDFQLFNEILESLSKFQEEPSNSIRGMVSTLTKDERIKLFQLFSNEKYNELVKMNFEARERIFPSEYTLDELIEFTFVDNDIAYCRSLMFRTASALRSGLLKEDKLLLLLVQLDEKIKLGGNRFILQNESMDLMIYYMLCCEINIRNSRINEALENISVCRKILASDFGSYAFTIVQHGENIMRFYEAWALGSFAEMEDSIKDIPREDIAWIHELCLSVGKELRKKAGGIFSAGEAIKHLNYLSTKFTNISQFNNVTMESKKQITEYLNKIKFRLDEKELRIAVVGETSTGKTTFLNALFNTDLFFTTQEEATGVPTEIRKGIKTIVEVLDSKGKIRSALNSDRGSWFNSIISSIGTDKKDNMVMSAFRKLTNLFDSKDKIADITDCSPAEFIAKHTKIAESGLAWIDKVKVMLPIEELPDNAVIIDTPGFNASHERAEIAKKVIADAHVCIFLIDARNALKNKEMEILQMVREEAGKTFFVLNKMDLVFSDDDLDCDGEDSVDMTLDRVKLDLKKYFNLKDVMLYPISCLPKEQLQRDALKYYDNLSILKESIFKEAVIKKVELLVDMAAKEAVGLSNSVIKISENLIRSQLAVENKLLQSIPVDPELFRSEIEERVLGHYYTGRSRYIDIIIKTIDSELKLASDSFYNWIVSVSSKNVLKNDTQSKAESSINAAVNRIEDVRRRELDKLSSSVIKEIENTFRELYSNLPFKASYNSRNLSDSISILSLSHGGGLQGTISGISDDISKENTAAAIGAAVGMFLGPLGAIAGGFLGGLLFGKPIGEMKEEIWKVYCESIDKAYCRIVEVYDKDISNNNMQSYVNRLTEVIDVEIKRYNSEINSRINLHNEDMKKVNKDIIKLKLNAYEIKDEIEVLQSWRNKRRSDDNITDNAERFMEDFNSDVYVAEDSIAVTGIDGLEIKNIDSYSEVKNKEDIKKPKISFSFKDKNLEKAICEKIGKKPKEITVKDLEQIKTLNIKSKNIKYIDGIEYLSNLKVLNISYNDVENIEPLGYLTDLVELDLTYNGINDITCLKGNMCLSTLYVSGNRLNFESLNLISKMNLIYSDMQRL